MSEDEVVTPEVVPEPEPSTVEIDWRGVTVKVPASLNYVDPDAIEAFENAKAISGLRLAIGSDEYDRARRRFESVNKYAPTMVDIGGERDVNSDASKASLAYLVMQHLGFIDAGE